METQWAVSRAPESRQDSRRSTSAISDSSSRWPRQTVAWTASTAATRCASEWKSFLPTLTPTDPGEERKISYRTYVRLSSSSGHASRRATGKAPAPSQLVDHYISDALVRCSSLSEDPRRHTLSLSHQPQQDVLGPDVPVPQLPSLPQ